MNAVDIVLAKVSQVLHGVDLFGVDLFLSNFSNLIEWLNDMGIECFITVTAFQAFNNGILLGLAKYDEFELNAFWLTPTGNDCGA